MWDENLVIYDKIVAATGNKLERKGKTVPYTSANGYMFSLLNKEAQLGIRLPEESRLKFIEKYNAAEFRSHGAVMRDYVLIPDELLGNTKLLSNLLDEAYEYVMSLPTK